MHELVVKALELPAAVFIRSDPEHYRDPESLI